MPAPQSSVMQELAKAQFRTFMIKLPLDWRQPQGEAGKQYVQAFKPSELVAVPPVGRLFIPASVNKYHCDTVSEISGKFESFIDGICGAVCQAWATWQAAATITGVTIFGPVATLGELVGPPWLPLIMGAAPKSTPMELRYSMAIAMTLSNAWMQYTATVKVPGMAWYPAFAAFPGPMAPPIPNVPTPLITCLSPAAISICAPTDMKSAMDNALDGGLKSKDNDKQYEALHDAIATVLSAAFTIWLAAQQVMLVMGKGPIPSFAPPYVPVGPVVGGDIISAPGHLIS